MSFSPENIELFERALKDELSPKEKIDFQLNLADKEFSEAFKTYQLLHAGIIKTGRKNLKDHLKSLESSIQTSNNTKGKLSRFYPSNKLWIIVAVLLGLFLVSYFILSRSKSPETSKVYLAYYTKFPNTIDPIEKSEQSELKSLYQYYESGDYTQVEESAKDSLNNENVKWYLAMTYMATSQLKKAEAALISEIDNDSIYKEHAQWYLALVYMKTNRIDESKKLFEGLTSSNLKYYKEKSKEILDQL